MWHGQLFCDLALAGVSTVPALAPSSHQSHCAYLLSLPVCLVNYLVDHASAQVPALAISQFEGLGACWGTWVEMIYLGVTFNNVRMIMDRVKENFGFGSVVGRQEDCHKEGG